MPVDEDELLRSNMEPASQNQPARASQPEPARARASQPEPANQRRPARARPATTSKPEPASQSQPASQPASQPHNQPGNFCTSTGGLPGLNPFCRVLCGSAPAGSQGRSSFRFCPWISPEAPRKLPEVNFMNLLLFVVSVRLSARWISEPLLLQILPVDLPGSSPEAPGSEFYELVAICGEACK